ncbi:gamma-glutamyl-gamma-aminobutyrate hydrolase family protein [Flammeovirga yaeyamensis]|uniref:Gamma-glutamyl-gamma-aminobutyrate hydrolase family protein n=1 Tax=Flammeovirga yaeyamensis TaxID=367791 RepID=A0AAX1N4L0_9BACT|nr:gamma-glutamyl-gamma-aminobutyrate hydrolase family protein [Flammeovirga yaeyamensis]MBB3700282.1 putative glutamine amidotransferase [Flammeovirga yaeyamensis]NMF37092.1 gamma-glutamyl-gamma-aminobutyrate hydrolase family protein [Flammeovirga yaeyamensis]QWG00783.1 gamma-glutamyl-gamma-aminobutyrate hydrolase family protein [Flammeovirga yaeyamensis]
MIKIGISSCFMYPDTSRSTFGPKSLSYVENDMMEYVSQNGVLPILLPDINKEKLKRILDELQGVVLQGGVDVAPEMYGEKPIGKWLGDAYRDEYELFIIEEAIKRNIPVFGICRGFQLLNVYYGGTLYQDTITQRPQSLNHRSAELYDKVNHKITIHKATPLYEIYPFDQDVFVNSVHHQAIKDLSNELEIWATSEDGLIEAFGHKNFKGTKVMGVQWHPEFSKTLNQLVINANPLIQLFIHQAL